MHKQKSLFMLESNQIGLLEIFNYFLSGQGREEILILLKCLLLPV